MNQDLGVSPLQRTAAQFIRQSLWGMALVGSVLLALGLWIGIGRAGGAVCVSVATSVLASVFVAAVALERQEFAQVILDLGVRRIFHDRRAAMPDHFWPGLIRSAEHFFGLLGTANHGYLTSAAVQQETREAFQAAFKKDGFRAAILWLDPESNLARCREDEESRRGTRLDTINSIMFFSDLREQLGVPHQHFRLRTYSSMPTCGITWADDQLVVVHYLTGRLNLQSPGLLLEGTAGLMSRLGRALVGGGSTDPTLVDVYRNNFKEVDERHAKDVDAARLEHLRRLKDKLDADPASQKLSEAQLRAELGGGDSRGV